MDLKLITKARAGNRKARNALIESLMPVAMMEAGRWRKLDPADARGIALLALTESVDAALLSHDAREAGILAYVRKSIRRALSHAHDTRQAVNAPLDMQGQFRSACAGQSIPERTRRTLQHSLPRAHYSLDAPISNCRDDGEARTLIDLFADPTVQTPEVVAGAAESRAMLYSLLLGVIDSPRDAYVLSMCFGLDGEDPMDQSEVAAQTGLSIGTIKSIRAAALKKWRQMPQLHSLLQGLVTSHE